MKHTPVNSAVLKPLLIGAGSLSLGIGILGIFLPVLPTTPFILVSGFCFARSSTRLHRWLLTSRLTKKTYGRILNKEGLTLKMKISVLAAAWTMLILAALFLAKSTAMRVVYPALGVVKTVIFFTVIKTAPAETDRSCAGLSTRAPDDRGTGPADNEHKEDRNEP